MLALFKKVHLFSGLNEEELALIADLSSVHAAASHELIVQQNTTGSEVYIIGGGDIEVFVKGLDDERALVVLGEGQLFGEMALLGQGYRSASGRAGKTGCKTYIIDAGEFNKLCEENTHIGYVVMRNLALDLSFKLRHRNLAGM